MFMYIGLCFSYKESDVEIVESIDADDDADDNNNSNKVIKNQPNRPKRQRRRRKSSAVTEVDGEYERVISLSEAGLKQKDRLVSKTLCRQRPQATYSDTQGVDQYLTICVSYYKLNLALMLLLYLFSFHLQDLKIPYRKKLKNILLHESLPTPAHHTRKWSQHTGLLFGSMLAFVLYIISTYFLILIGIFPLIFNDFFLF